MKAMVIVPAKEGATLKWREVPDPEPGPGQLLMRVKAAGLNRADIFQLKGLYEMDRTAGGSLTIAGLEAAGEVVGIGKDVSGSVSGGVCRTRHPGPPFSHAGTCNAGLGRGGKHFNRTHGRIQRPCHKRALAGG